MVNVPSEYGITDSQKYQIGMGIAHRLIDKIHEDLCWWKKNTYGNIYKTEESKSDKDAIIKDENQNWD